MSTAGLSGRLGMDARWRAGRLDPVPARLVLSYRVQRHGGEWQDVEQPTPIVWMPCRFGGARPYFVCPGYRQWDCLRSAGDLLRHRMRAGVAPHARGRRVADKAYGPISLKPIPSGSSGSSVPIAVSAAFRSSIRQRSYWIDLISHFAAISASFLATKP
jgi:hypothetical protein